MVVIFDQTHFVSYYPKKWWAIPLIFLQKMVLALEELIFHRYYLIFELIHEHKIIIKGKTIRLNLNQCEK